MVMADGRMAVTRLTAPTAASVSGPGSYGNCPVAAPAAMLMMSRPTCWPAEKMACPQALTAPDDEHADAVQRAAKQRRKVDVA